MWVHGLSAVHAFTIACGFVWFHYAFLLRIFNPLWRGWVWVSILCILFPFYARSCLGTSPFFFNSAPISFYCWFVGRLVFLPRHFIAFVMLLLDLCLLGLLWACHIFFLYSVHVAQYFCWVNSHTILGLLSPFYSFGHSWPILFLHSHGILINLSGFPGPIIISFTFEVCWPLHQPHLLIPFFGLLRPIFACFPFLIVLIGLQLSSLGSLGPICFLWGLFYCFIGP